MRRLLSLALILFLITACFPPIKPPTPEPIPPNPIVGDNDVSGEWIGRLRSDDDFYIGIYLNLSELDGEIFGIAHFTEELVQTSGVVSGEIHEFVHLTILVESGFESITLELTGTVIDGVFQGTILELIGTRGTFALWRPE